MNATTDPTSYPTTYPADATTDRLPRQDRRAPRPAPQRPALDAARLWTGGLATAVVAALVGLVGLLVVRVLGQAVPHGYGLAGVMSQSGMLCLGAAVAALAATGVAHLLLVSTPRPLAYLGWIVGLSTAAAAVLPFTTGAPLAAALAAGAIHLVIGMAIGSLVVNAAASALRLPGSDW